MLAAARLLDQRAGKQLMQTSSEWWRDLNVVSAVLALQGSSLPQTTRAYAAKSGGSFTPCFWCIKAVTGFDFDQKTSLLQHIWGPL
jgi:hypothetical protein